MPGQPVLETKQTLDGRVQSFSTTAVLLSPRLAVVRFDHPAAREAGGFSFPVGSHTLGFFWPGRRYVCYRMAGPDGALLAHRFDVAERVRINESRVSFADLLLDVWVSPAGVLTIEDEAEVAAAVERGFLSERQQATIARTRTLLLTKHTRIIAECEAVAATIRA